MFKELNLAIDCKLSLSSPNSLAQKTEHDAQVASSEAARGRKHACAKRNPPQSPLTLLHFLHVHAASLENMTTTSGTRALLCADL